MSIAAESTFNDQTTSAGTAERSEWIGLRGRLGARLLASPLRRLLERLVFGQASGRLAAELVERLQPDHTVLDVGAGSGYFGLPVAARLDAGGKLIALDLSREMLAHLVRRARRRGLADRVLALRGSATAIDLADGSVDLAISGAALHEMGDPLAALAEIVRVLRPGGWAVLSDFARGFGHDHESAHGAFSVDELAGELTDLGLGQVRAYPIKKQLIAIGQKPRLTA